MIPKIIHDTESNRHQKNMTKTQIKNDNNVKEGVIVNTFVKDNSISLNETKDTLIISDKKIELPEKLFEKNESKNKTLLPLCGISLGVMGVFAGFTSFLKKFSKSRLNNSKEFLLPGITRNHCINNEIHQSIFSMIQSPNRKTILSSIGVIALGTTAYISKTFIDGFKDVWIKKQEADIQKKLQENLIEVETQSFSGKMQIIRSMLTSKANDFSKELNFKSKPNRNDNNSYLLLGGITLFSIIGLGYLTAKNLRKSDEYINKGLKNTRIGLDNVIKEFNEGKKITNLQGNNGIILSGKEAYKHLIENLLESIYATPNEIETYINKLNLPNEEKKEFISHLKDSINQATEQVNPMIGGSGRNKITYFSHVNDYLSFFYDWLMNPKNPQFKNLFFGIAGISAIGYIGKSATEAIKEVQVKKFNAETELNLQKKLVSTELRNFNAKKEAAIEPLCKEFYEQKHAGKSTEELKIMADNILFEIKNGPPFVYS